jgi:hypothetical protein
MNAMHYRFLVILILSIFPASLFGQFEGDFIRFEVYEQQGVVYGVGDMSDVVISAARPTKAELKRGKRKLEDFNRLRWNVHKVYPYAIGVSELLVDVQARLDSFQSGQEKRQYMKAKEETLFGEYEQDIRKMTRKQGIILIKLVHRETGDNVFSLIKDVKSGISAVFWQSISRIFGMSLKNEYDFDEDAMIEAIVNELEGGGYNIVYKQYNFAFSPRMASSSQ